MLLTQYTAVYEKNQCIFYILNKVVMLGFMEKTAQNVQTTA